MTVEGRLFWKTSDPNALEAIGFEANRWKEFVQRVHEENLKYGVTFQHSRNPFDGSYICIGVKGDASRLPGEWRKPTERSHWLIRPYRRDPIGRQILEKLSFEIAGIPGLPRVVSEGTGVMTNRFTEAFLSDGCAWASTGIGRPSLPGDLPVNTTIWELVSESEYRQAMQDKEKEDDNDED